MTAITFGVRRCESKSAILVVVVGVVEVVVVFVVVVEVVVVVAVVVVIVVVACQSINRSVRGSSCTFWS